MRRSQPLLSGLRKGRHLIAAICMMTFPSELHGSSAHVLFNVLSDDDLRIYLSHFSFFHDRSGVGDS